MKTQTEIKFGSTRATLTTDLANASAPILIDGSATGYQTADARHDLRRAAELAVAHAFDVSAEDAADVEISE